MFPDNVGSPAETNYPAPIAPPEPLLVAKHYGSKVPLGIAIAAIATAIAVISLCALPAPAIAATLLIAGSVVCLSLASSVESRCAKILLTTAGAACIIALIALGICFAPTFTLSAYSIACGIICAGQGIAEIQELRKEWGISQHRRRQFVGLTDPAPVVVPANEGPKLRDQVTVEEVRALFLAYKKAIPQCQATEHALYEAVRNEGEVPTAAELSLREGLSRDWNDAKRNSGAAKWQYNNGMKALMAQLNISRHDCFQLIAQGPSPVARDEEQSPANGDRPQRRIDFADKTVWLQIYDADTPSERVERHTRDTGFTEGKPKLRKKQPGAIA